MIEFEGEMRSRLGLRVGRNARVVSSTREISQGYVLGKKKTCHDVSQVQRNAMIHSEKNDRTEHAIMHHGPDQIERRRYRRRAVGAGRTSSLSISV